MHRMNQQIKELFSQHLRSGPKSARRTEYRKVVAFIEWVQINEHGVRDVRQIGRGHVLRFLNYKQTEDRVSEKTLYDYCRALQKFWVGLGRPAGFPPAPSAILK